MFPCISLIYPRPSRTASSIASRLGCVCLAILSVLHLAGCAHPPKLHPVEIGIPLSPDLDTMDIYILRDHLLQGGVVKDPELAGMPRQTLEIRLDREKMALYGIRSGKVEEEMERTYGKRQPSLEELEHLMIFPEAPEARPVQLQDVADIVVRQDEPQLILNHRPCIVLRGHTLLDSLALDAVLQDFLHGGQIEYFLHFPPSQP